MGHPLGVSGNIFLVEKERHTGEKASILVQIMSITAAGNLRPGRRASGEGKGEGSDGWLRTSRHTVGGG